MRGSTFVFLTSLVLSVFSSWSVYSKAQMSVDNFIGTCLADPTKCAGMSILESLSQQLKEGVQDQSDLPVNKHALLSFFSGIDFLGMDLESVELGKLSQEQLADIKKQLEELLKDKLADLSQDQAHKLSSQIAEKLQTGEMELGHDFDEQLSSYLNASNINIDVESFKSIDFSDIKEVLQTGNSSGLMASLGGANFVPRSDHPPEANELSNSNSSDSAEYSVASPGASSQAYELKELGSNLLDEGSLAKNAKVLPSSKETLGFSVETSLSEGEPLLPSSTKAIMARGNSLTSTASSNPSSGESVDHGDGGESQAQTGSSNPLNDSQALDGATPAPAPVNEIVPSTTEANSPSATNQTESLSSQANVKPEQKPLSDTVAQYNSNPMPNNITSTSPTIPASKQEPSQQTVAKAPASTEAKGKTLMEEYLDVTVDSKKSSSAPILSQNDRQKMIDAISEQSLLQGNPTYSSSQNLSKMSDKELVSTHNQLRDDRRQSTRATYEADKVVVSHTQAYKNEQEIPKSPEEENLEAKKKFAQDFNKSVLGFEIKDNQIVSDPKSFNKEKALSVMGSDRCLGWFMQLNLLSAMKTDQCDAVYNTWKAAFRESMDEGRDCLIHVASLAKSHKLMSEASASSDLNVAFDQTRYRALSLAALEDAAIFTSTKTSQSVLKDYVCSSVEPDRESALSRLISKLDNAHSGSTQASDDLNAKCDFDKSYNPVMLKETLASLDRTVKRSASTTMTHLGNPYFNVIQGYGNNKSLSGAQSKYLDMVLGQCGVMAAHCAILTKARNETGASFTLDEIFNSSAILNGVKTSDNMYKDEYNKKQFLQASFQYMRSQGTLPQTCNVVDLDQRLEEAVMEEDSPVLSPTKTPEHKALAVPKDAI